MKHMKVIAFVLTGLVMVNLAGCGGLTGHGNDDMPYPDGWAVNAEVDIQEKDSDMDQLESFSAVEEQPTEETIKTETEETVIPEMPKEKSTVSKDVNYLFDTSKSMYRSPSVIKVHSAAERAGAGMNQNYYVLDKDKAVVETDEQLALSGKYGSGAIIDVIGRTEIPVDPYGVNVLTTDLQSGTTATTVGEWLVETGCTGYTFYVFNMEYDGNVDFKAYTSNTTMEYVSVSGCCFDREFLMIVFGGNNIVEEYDESFQKKLGEEISYDFCHVSIGDLGDDVQDGILKLDSSRCFSKNEVNIKYDNTNYCYGLSLEDTSKTVFTILNTFVYKKSKKSAGDNTEAVKAVLYAVPEEEIPEIIRQEVTVLEYDSEKGKYIKSDIQFEVEVEGFLDGLPAAEEGEMNTNLGGNLVPEDKAALMVTVENKSLPRGLFAIDVSLVCETDGEAADLQKFADRHGAGLDEYTQALRTDCIPKVINGVDSTSKYDLITKGDSVYSKLLEFERIADELIAAGALPENVNDVINLRVIIDNRK